MRYLILREKRFRKVYFFILDKPYFRELFEPRKIELILKISTTL